MTVAELIEHLKQWPADRRVVVCGYESGFCDVAPPSALKLKINARGLVFWAARRYQNGWRRSCPGWRRLSGPQLSEYRQTQQKARRLGRAA